LVVLNGRYDEPTALLVLLRSSVTTVGATSYETDREFDIDASTALSARLRSLAPIIGHDAAVLASFAVLATRAKYPWFPGFEATSKANGIIYTAHRRANQDKDEYIPSPQSDKSDQKMLMEGGDPSDLAVAPLWIGAPKWWDDSWHQSRKLLSGSTQGFEI
jgi:hypothetical protein